MPTTTTRPSAHRTIPVRRLEIDKSNLFPVGGGQREAGGTDQPWTVTDDPIFSHFMAMLSALFPHGEEFFVRTVRDHRDAIGSDDHLRGQINAFIGQEAMHGREHRALNDLLAPLGYPVEDIDAGVKRVCERLLRLPGALPLAVTAAAEHITGTLAPEFLDDPGTQHVLLSSSDELATLVHWHALEELEHKNVAFDVLAAVDGRYLVRAAGFGIMLSALGGFGLMSWVRAVHGDRQRITPQHRRTFLSNLRRQGVISPRVGWAVLGYLRPGFHPDDTDTDAMVVEWRRRLEDRTTVIANRRAS